MKSQAFKNVIENLSKKNTAKLKIKISEWYTSDQCVIHRTFLEFMIRTLVYTKCKHMS